MKDTSQERKKEVNEEASEETSRQRRILRNERTWGQGKVLKERL